MSRKRLAIISPHFSTGGAPQVTLNKVELLKDHYDIIVVEYAFLAWNYVVQRNKVIDILGDKFYSLGDNKHELLDILDLFNPDVVSMEEFPEMFMDDMLTRELYREDRSYRIIETTHDSSFNPEHKKWMPDKFVFVSAYNILKYSHLDVPMKVIEYPVNLKTDERPKKVKQYLDICIVGLWTPRKNQAYAIELARQLEDYNVKFHFIGNHADNFRYYWEPIMKEFPSNCKWWNERTDVENFYQAADLFLFTSKGSNTDKETMPLVIREAISWQVPSLIYNLPVYLDYFNTYKNISYLKDDVVYNIDKIIKQLNLNNKMNFTVRYDKSDNKILYTSFET